MVAGCGGMHNGSGPFSVALTWPTLKDCAAHVLEALTTQHAVFVSVGLTGHAHARVVLARIHLKYLDQGLFTMTSQSVD